MTINVEMLRSRLMKLSKDELVTELIGALLELAVAPDFAEDRRSPEVSE